MTCPLLEYRDGDTDRSFDVARAYCTAVDAFVQPMRTDVCNGRYDLQHAEHCEFYREHADAQGAAASVDDGDGPGGVGDARDDA